VVLCRQSSRGWAAFRRVARSVPFPSSRWRFYNIHPACTHVGTVIPPPPPPPRPSTLTNTLPTIEETRGERGLSRLLIGDAASVPLSLDLRPLEKHGDRGRRRDISERGKRAGLHADDFSVGDMRLGMQSIP